MDEQGRSGTRDDSTTQRKAGFLATLRAVLWSFFGVRRKSDYERDAAQLNPVHVIIAGVIAAAVFVLTLIMIVRAVTS
jgi:hypothetical protein